MNAEQFNLLLNKLEKLQKEREGEEVVCRPSKGSSDKAKLKKHISYSKYPNDISKY